MQHSFPQCGLRALGVLLLGGLSSACLMAEPQVGKDKGPKDPKGPQFGEVKTVQGTVQDFTTAPKGEVDGLILSDGTAIHWPPHMAQQFSGIVAKGDKVKAVGRMANDPKGGTKLETATLTNLRTGKSQTNPDLELPESTKSGSVEQRLQKLADRMDELLQEVRRLKGKK